MLLCKLLQFRLRLMNRRNLSFAQVADIAATFYALLVVITLAIVVEEAVLAVVILQ